MERGWGVGGSPFPELQWFGLRERWRAWDGAGGDGGDVGHRVKATRCKEIRFGARGGTAS